MEDKQLQEAVAAATKTIDERITKALEQLTQKEDLTPYFGLSAREIYAAQKKRALMESLHSFSESEAAKMTVKELLTSTSNIALPTLLQNRALLELTGNWADMREVSMIASVPKGSGKTVDTQVMTQPTFGTWDEGSALSAADPTLAKRTVTLAPFGKVTQVSDLLANTSVINFVEEIGRLHGACVRQGIFSKICTVLSAGAGNTVSAASGSTLTFADVRNAIKEIAADGFVPDFIVTSPSNMWTAFSTSDAITQYYGSLNNLMASGLGKVVRNVLGLDWYADPYWDTLFPVAVKKLAYVGCKGQSAIWAALQEEPVVELYRVPTELASYIITHMDGGAAYGSANSICTITYAS
jgi:hypothetical protein